MTEKSSVRRSKRGSIFFPLLLIIIGLIFLLSKNLRGGTKQKSQNNKSQLTHLVRFYVCSFNFKDPLMTSFRD